MDESMGSGRAGIRRSARLARHAVAATTGALLLIGTAVGGAAPSVASEPTGSGWEVIPAPPLRGQTDLTDVTAFSPTDAWAVGYVRDWRGVSTLTLHWDGRRWLRVPSPNRSDQQNWLFGVAGSSSSDVWAVGYDVDDDLNHRTLVMRWDGNRWTIVPSPNVGSLGSTLTSVTVVSPTDAWAVGNATRAWPLVGQTLVEHWDGTAWSVVPSPDPSTTGLGSNLLGVTATTGTDVWAVGDFSEDDWVMHTLTERWDGTSWSVVASPTASEGALLDGVAAAGHEVWAVGWRQEQAQLHPLVTRWDGRRWAVVGASTFDGIAGWLADVAVTGSGDVWAVGSLDRAEVPFSRTLTARWDGTGWTIVPGADPGPIANSLTAVTPIPGTDCLWAVGQTTSDQDAGKALIERYCG